MAGKRSRQLDHAELTVNVTASSAYISHRIPGPKLVTAREPASIAPPVPAEAEQ
jgi:hypothetical protein